MKQTKKAALRGLVLCLCAAALLLGSCLSAGAVSATPEEVLVGGMPFGVRFLTDGVLVVGYSDVKTAEGDKNPAREAGILPGDCIIKWNGTALTSTEALAAGIEDCGEGTLSLTVRREGAEKEVTLSPATCSEDGRHRVGLLVRDSGAGIGTVTFVVEKTGAFGGLGHGICDGESGTPIPLLRGSVMGVSINGITKGAIGAPGELRGHFTSEKTGALFCNTVCGVFGVLTDAPAGAERLPIGHRDRVHNGEATLRCTLEDGSPADYRVEISGIRREETGNKCFTVHVTDEALLSKTGGIVQGMSGSPILQDGHIIGAVTHVLIGDPTSGFGIFIDNMLAAMPDAG